ncbi:MAG: hypothetical protein E7220_08305 [Clostridiales bacterium]|nr:hypothetical protein [Clostridiales bacterium]
MRDFGTHLTDAETVSIALLQAVSGGIITTSDPVYRLSEERRQLLEFIRPTVRETAEFPFLTEDREEIVITHILNDWNLLYVMNPTQHPLRVHFSMEELFGTEALFQYRFEWTDGEKSCPGSSTCFSETLAPHDSVLLFLTEEPMNGRPSNIWDRRQVIL